MIYVPFWSMTDDRWSMKNFISVCEYSNYEGELKSSPSHIEIILIWIGEKVISVFSCFSKRIYSYKFQILINDTIYVPFWSMTDDRWKIL